jgi:hypothetical protein
MIGTHNFNSNGTLVLPGAHVPTVFVSSPWSQQFLAMEVKKPHGLDVNYYCRDCGAAPGDVCGFKQFWGTPFVHDCRPIERIDCPGFSIRAAVKPSVSEKRGGTGGVSFTF